MGKSIGALRARAKAQGLSVRKLANGQYSITGRGRGRGWNTNIRANTVNAGLRLLSNKRGSYGTNF